MKINVGVFFGGKSVEHEISVISALQTINAINKEKYEVVPIYIAKNNIMYTGSKLSDINSYKNIDKLLESSTKVNIISADGKYFLVKYPFRKFSKNVISTIDIAFPVVHGTNVEDGTLQGFFETIGIPYVGCNVLSSALGMDKFAMKAVFEKNNIPVLPCVCLGEKEYSENSSMFIDEIENNITYPVIIKPINLGSSIGISKANNRNELQESIEMAFDFSNRIIAERAIKNLKEINCSVVGDFEQAEASACEEPINVDDILSFQDKYLESGNTKGMTSLKRKLPAEISPEIELLIKGLAVKAFKSLNCNGVSRIDFLIDNDTNDVWVNEINTIPGSLSFYLWEAVGVSFPDLTEKLIKLAFKKHREKENVSYSYDTNILSNMTFGSKSGKSGNKNG
jgi:D-alanine-D-alanine ligase